MAMNFLNREIYYFIKYVLCKKRLLNLLKVKLSVLFRASRVNSFPITVRLEPTNTCNLHCPLCPAGQNLLKREKGFLSFENAKKIIDEAYEYSLHLRLFGAGEPLLNKDLFKIIEYAKAKNMLVNFHTNAYFLDEFNIKKVIDSGVDELVVSLDGASQETYSKYRVGGDFERALTSLKLLFSKRSALRKTVPRVTIQFIVMGHNEHEIPLIKKIVKELKADRLSIISVSIGSEFINSYNLQFLPISDKFSRYFNVPGEGIVFKKERICYAPWEEVSISWDGGAYVCCNDILKTQAYSYIKGNVFKEDTVASLWNSKDYVAFRSSLLNQRKDIAICASCEGYKPFGSILK